MIQIQVLPFSNSSYYMIPGSAKLLNGRLKAGMFGLHLTTGTVKLSSLSTQLLQGKKRVCGWNIFGRPKHSLSHARYHLPVICSQGVQPRKADPICLKSPPAREMSTFPWKHQYWYFLVIRLSSVVTCNQRRGSTEVHIYLHGGGRHHH